MSSHPMQIELEQKLRAMADDLDHFLEDRFEGLYPLHPNRLPRGKKAVLPTMASSPPAPNSPPATAVSMGVAMWSVSRSGRSARSRRRTARPSRMPAGSISRRSYRSICRGERWSSSGMEMSINWSGTSPSAHPAIVDPIYFGRLTNVRPRVYIPVALLHECNGTYQSTGFNITIYQLIRNSYNLEQRTASLGQVSEDQGWGDPMTYRVASLQAPADS